MKPWKAVSTLHVASAQKLQELKPQATRSSRVASMQHFSWRRRPLVVQAVAYRPQDYFKIRSQHHPVILLDHGVDTGPASLPPLRWTARLEVSRTVSDRWLHCRCFVSTSPYCYHRYFGHPDPEPALALPRLHASVSRRGTTKPKAREAFHKSSAAQTS